MIVHLIEVVVFVVAVKGVVAGTVGEVVVIVGSDGVVGVVCIGGLVGVVCVGSGDVGCVRYVDCDGSLV